MKSSFTRRWVAFATTTGLAVTLGCGSSGGSASGSGCDAYFQAALRSGCDGGPLPPQSEISRVQGIFETICANEEALPGSGVTDSALGACASAIQAAGCNLNLSAIAACQVTGSLVAGTPCNDSGQCQSGTCDFTIGSGGSVPACGTCEKSAAVGQPCGMTGVSCTEGAECDQSGTNATCKTVTFGGAGSPCESPYQQCSSGYYCVFGVSSAACKAVGTMGSSCTDATQCQFPLACVQEKCGPRSGSGGPCTSDGDCTSGLGCDTTTRECGSVTWVSAGASCSTIVRCLVGDCSANGKCPSVVPNGQACVETSTTAVCDTLSGCVNGMCALPGTPVCH